jgi:hypothetical protein
MKPIIARTLLALLLLSIAAGQNPPMDGPVVPINGEGDLEYLTKGQAAALRETWEGNIVRGENYFDDEMFQNTEDRTGGVTGGTIGGIDLVPQPDATEVSAPTNRWVRKEEPPCGGKVSLAGARGGAAGRAQSSRNGCGRNLRPRAPE